MLRIDSIHHANADVVVSLSGQVRLEYLGELEQLIARLRGEGRAVRFDFRDVGLVDRAAVTFFASGPGRDLAIDRCPRYLREWLRLEGRDLHDVS